jgi:hypothetical protein
LLSLKRVIAIARGLENAGLFDRIFRAAKWNQLA